MKLLLDTVLPVLIPLLLPLFSAGFLWATAKAGSFFAAKAKESKAFAVTASTYELVRATVEHVERHLRPQLADALKDGQLSKAEADKLKSDALRLLKEALGQQGLLKLKAVFGDGVELLLSGWIERANKEKTATVALLSSPK